MKLLLAIIFMTVQLAGYAFAQSATISPKDLKIIEGPKWSGTLTYLDYNSNKNTSIKSELTVTRLIKDPATWRFDYTYPDEPKANRSSEAALSKNGRMFFGEDVVEQKKLRDGSVKIVTTQAGSDDDKPALFRYTYLIGDRAFSIKKEVRINGTEAFFERNTYSWTR
jgi:hypothetical protein